MSSQARSNRRRYRSHLKPMAEINVTPFVDVMLVLLVIFMVAAPLLSVGVEIDLPETAAEPLPEPEEDPLTVSLTADGQVAIQDTVVARDTLIAKLRAVAETRTDRQVYLRAEAGLDYGAVMEIMGALQAAGFTELGLVTDPGGPRLDAE
ncbi:MAG: protein TolR [Mangrovicoccus sp.]